MASKKHEDKGIKQKLIGKKRPVTSGESSSSHRYPTFYYGFWVENMFPGNGVQPKSIEAQEVKLNRTLHCNSCAHDMTFTAAILD